MTRQPDQILDEALVLHAQHGRREALDRLADRWRARHYVHARRLLGSELAADAVQDAWISIIRGLWRLRDPAHFPAWSYAIVTRRAQDLMRRVARAKESPLAEDIEDEQSKHLISTEKLDEGLKLLPQDQRTAIALFYRDELTVAEIAKVLSIPIGTVKTRLFHARRTLRRHLAGDES